MAISEESNTMRYFEFNVEEKLLIFLEKQKNY